MIMETKKSNIEKARFDTRLSAEQKALFERAARLGGYRSLTDFVVLTVQKRAKEIIHESDQILASQKDSEIFFDAITNSGKPNQKLTEAANEYRALLSK
jgi:uncharacterized protein (DUF1778 family)